MNHRSFCPSNYSGGIARTSHYLQNHGILGMSVVIAGWMIVMGKKEASQAEASPKQQTARTVHAPVVPTGMSPMSPTLPIRVIRPNPNLEIAFDVRTRTPIYVLETLSSNNSDKEEGQQDQQQNKRERRRPHFYEEKSIVQETYRSRLSHYRNTGYDRGHMAPAADFPNEKEDTFNLCNVAPQDHLMNVSIWNRLEAWTRRVAADATANANANANSGSTGQSTTYVVTGPLWLPKRQVLLMNDNNNEDESSKASVPIFEYSHFGLGRPPSLVWVPTHFFKVVVVVLSNNDSEDEEASIVQFACFVVENAPPPSKAKKPQLQDYVVPWTDLETVTGLQFFPNLATTKWKEWADHRTHDSVIKYISSSSQQLLLIDGSSTVRTSKNKKPKHSVCNSTLEHLCQEGQCKR